MAGHSKWANIKHRKAKVDAQRGRLFTKLGRAIVAAARQGGGDPNVNQALKLAIARAREMNMPMENINRAIMRATGEMEGESYEEVTYEGYAPGGVALLLKILTDNRNRTASEIRHLFSRHGGSLGETGCVAWMFEMKGFLVIPKENIPGDEEELMLFLIEAGAEDVKEEGSTIEVVTAPQDLEKMKAVLTERGVKFSLAEVTMVPKTTVPITDPETAEKVLKLMDVLEDHDDVQHVYANFDIPEELMDRLEQ
ncbi:MAG: YebC/PmpR family DNA-binding transcriptional regulator [Firmicutes bacterium]|nr:YebC/PmpR family DNA-binding transcriptional regulator [Bacillota bacterium]